MIDNITNATKTIWTPIVKYGLERPINYVADRKFMTGICEKVQGKDSAKFLTKLATWSLVIKDGLGCYMYVKQSLHNKDIPEEKRKFVASLDLANGALMIAAQLLLAKTISGKVCQTKIFDKLLGKLFSRASRKGFMVELAKKEGVTKKEFNNIFEKYKKSLADTLSFITTLVATTIFAKRVIVPFISTPLAEKAKSLLYTKEENKK